MLSNDYEINEKCLIPGLFLLLTLGMLACENELVEDLRERNNPTEEPLPELTSGTADFSNYVALGPSFTAGFTDGGLFIAAQENSFPNTISSIVGVMEETEFRFILAFFQGSHESSVHSINFLNLIQYNH